MKRLSIDNRDKYCQLLKQSTKEVPVKKKVGTFELEIRQDQL